MLSFSTHRLAAVDAATTANVAATSALRNRGRSAAVGPHPPQHDPTTHRPSTHSRENRLSSADRVGRQRGGDRRVPRRGGQQRRGGRAAYSGGARRAGAHKEAAKTLRTIGCFDGGMYHPFNPS